MNNPYYNNPYQYPPNQGQSNYGYQAPYMQGQSQFSQQMANPYQQNMPNPYQPNMPNAYQPNVPNQQYYPQQQNQMYQQPYPNMYNQQPTYPTNPDPNQYYPQPQYNQPMQPNCQYPMNTAQQQYPDQQIQQVPANNVSDPSNMQNYGQLRQNILASLRSNPQDLANQNLIQPLGPQQQPSNLPNQQILPNNLPSNLPNNLPSNQPVIDPIQQTQQPILHNPENAQQHYQIPQIHQKPEQNLNYPIIIDQNKQNNIQAKLGQPIQNNLVSPNEHKIIPAKEPVQPSQDLIQDKNIANMLIGANKPNNDAPIQQNPQGKFPTPVYVDAKKPDFGNQSYVPQPKPKDQYSQDKDIAAQLIQCPKRAKRGEDEDQLEALRQGQPTDEEIFQKLSSDL